MFVTSILLVYCFALCGASPPPFLLFRYCSTIWISNHLRDLRCFCVLRLRVAYHLPFLYQLDHSIISAEDRVRSMLFLKLMLLLLLLLLMMMLMLMLILLIDAYIILVEGVQFIRRHPFACKFSWHWNCWVRSKTPEKHIQKIFTRWRVSRFRHGVCRCRSRFGFDWKVV